MDHLPPDGNVASPTLGSSKLTSSFITGQPTVRSTSGLGRI
jgi:hypothetical protein